jgi:putative phosphoribosyl transferase
LTTVKVQHEAMKALRFDNRAQAGRLLARRLLEYDRQSDAIVLALPRGGVPVAYEVARELRISLDVVVVRKIRAPFHREFAIGAIASGGGYTINRYALEALGITSGEFLTVFAREQEELHRQEQLFRDEQPPLEITGKTVILIDDGAATGSTMHAAVEALRQRRPAKIIVALPVASNEAYEQLREVADEAICLYMPEPFRAVGLHYADFSQVSDDEARDLLARAMALVSDAR